MGLLSQCEVSVAESFLCCFLFEWLTFRLIKMIGRSDFSIHSVDAVLLLFVAIHVVFAKRGRCRRFQMRFQVEIPNEGWRL